MEEKELPLVLCVDDDPIIRKTIAKQLEGIARVVTATNTFEAEEKMRALIPALVTLDDIMPNCPTGLTFLERIKKEEDLANIPVIMVTASDKNEEILRGLRAGACAYVTKPFVPAELRATVAAQLARRPKSVWLALNDTEFATELAETFEELKCAVFEMEGDVAPSNAPPDLVVTESRARLDVLRKTPFCADVPVVLIVTAPEEGKGLSGRSSFLLRPVSAREVTRAAAQLMCAAGNREGAKDGR